MNKADLTINLYEKNRGYHAVIRRKEPGRNPENWGNLDFENVDDLASNIRHHWKSAQYRSITVWSGELEVDRQTPRLILEERPIEVTGPFGQCEGMYLLKTALEKILRQSFR